MGARTSVVDRLGRYRTEEGPKRYAEWDEPQWNWWCEWCEVKFHVDDPAIIHPYGEFCSERCLAKWGAASFNNATTPPTIDGSYTPRWSVRRRIKLEKNKDIKELFPSVV